MVTRIFLSPGQPHRVEHSHPWVYRNEIADVRGEGGDGSICDVFNSKGKFIARGYYNSKALIAFRALARKAVEIDEAFWRRRLEQAVAFRKERFSGQPACRLVHSEADFLPGLVVDRYGPVLSLQTNTLGMDIRKEMIADLLFDILKPKAIVENNSGSSRRIERLPEMARVLRGESDGKVQIRIGRVDFCCDLFDTHKTGFYLDQQANYEIVSECVRPGARVLDGFANTAGFALHLLLAGAAEAVAVESSAGSLERAGQSAELAGIGARLQCRCENMFDYLRRVQEDKEQFDLVVLDPPSFSRSRKSVSEARRGYKEIHLRAFKILKPGGILATFCCSHHVSATMFTQFILEAARDARVTLRRELILSAGPDHPVIPSIPETEYLKGAVYTVTPD